MAEKTTVARPYAEAAFAVARADGDLARWSEMLEALAAIAAEPVMREAIANPEVDRAALVEVMQELAGSVLTDKGRRFLRVVADNGRLALLPEIAQLYAAQRAEAERKVQAEVVSAFPLDDAQRQALVAALKRRLGREVSLDVRVDESLIGGAIVRAGDLVIDGSVTGQLERLAHTLMR
ncbi:MAG TPA: F0F1 ATP synthase subunit delta [Chromatiales bacterium]|nr:F0F1 ATP synthase subunit delta [Chromatiales bacterium]